jgi:hypothetical protein
MTKKKNVFKKGDRVVACPEAMKCPDKTGKITSHTKLTKDELMHGEMKVDEIREDGQLKIRHDMLKEPFVAHPKYFIPHQHQLQASATA